MMREKQILRNCWQRQAGMHNQESELRTHRISINKLDYIRYTVRQIQTRVSDGTSISSGCHSLHSFRVALAICFSSSSSSFQSNSFTKFLHKKMCDVFIVSSIYVCIMYLVSVASSWRTIYIHVCLRLARLLQNAYSTSLVCLFFRCCC